MYEELVPIPLICEELVPIPRICEELKLALAKTCVLVTQAGGSSRKHRGKVFSRLGSS